MRVLGFHPATLAATCILLLAGCGGVSFEHPLSDGETTAVDESLIGFWEAVPSSVGEEDPKTGELWPHIAVGKAVKSRAAMEAVALEVEDGVVKVQRLEVLATRIGTHRYLSLRDPEESGKSWYVLRYDVTVDDLLRMQVLDAEVLAQAVDDGELKGEAKGPDRGHEVVNLTVEITSETSVVRAWLAENEGCVESKGITLRRLVRKDSSGTTDPDAPGPPDPPRPPGPPEPPAPPAPALEPTPPSPPAEPDDDSEGPHEEHDAEHDQ